MGHLGIGPFGELAHAGIQQTHTLHRALFGAPAHQLQAYADAQHRLPKGTDHAVQPADAETGHGVGGIAHTGEDHLVGPSDLFRVGRQFILRAQALQGVLHRADVARFVVYNRYHNSPLEEGKS